MQIYLYKASGTFPSFAHRLSPFKGLSAAFAGGGGGGSPAGYTSSYSIAFDGVNELLSSTTALTAINLGSNVSVNWWVNAEGYYRSGQAMWSSWGTSSTDEPLSTFQDASYFYVYSRGITRGKRYAISGTNMTPNQWQMFTFVYSGSSAGVDDNASWALYIDNVYHTGSVLTAIPTSLVSGSSPFAIGARVAAANFFGPGMIDEVAIWDKPLTRTQVGNLYTFYTTGSNNDLTGSFGTPRPVHWWKMGDPGGQSMHPTIPDVGMSGTQPMTMINMEGSDITGSTY